MVETLTANYSWTKPEPGHSATTWGTFLNNDLDSIDSQLWTINTQVQTNTLSVSRGPNGGAPASIGFNNTPVGSATVGAQPRWVLYETSEAEGGGNAGSNFGLNAYSDSGAYLGSAFSIVRATQAVTFGGSVTASTFSGNPVFTGNITVNGAINCVTFGSNPTFTGNVTVNGGETVNGNLTVGGTLSLGGFNATNATIAYLNNTNATNFATFYAGTSFQINASSNDRYLQFASSPSCALHFRPSDSMLFWNTATGAVFQLQASGALFISGALTQNSDAAAKANIAAFDADPLAIVGAILPKWFNRTATPDLRELGFVAQDVQAALPEAVREGDGGMLGITETPLVAVLWRAVQELARRVEELEARFSP